MSSSTSISYVISSFIPLTRACTQACAYCAYAAPDASLMPINEVVSAVNSLAKRKATEVILISGESPQEFPHTQIALCQNGFASFSDYLTAVCDIVLKANMLPVIEPGYLEAFALDRFAHAGCSMRLNLVCAALSLKGQAHENARIRTPSNGKACIEGLHQAQIPYSLGFKIGIGETEKERLEFIKEIGCFCAADPWLQDVRIEPYQPVCGTKMYKRPPLPFEAVKNAVIAAKKAFQVHHISVPPWLFSRYAELVEYGLNDLGSVPVFSGDVKHPSFEIPAFETLKNNLDKKNICLYERGTLSTTSALNRPEVINAVTSTRELIKKRNLTAINLIENDHCFVCGSRNLNGMHIDVKKHIKGHTCTFNWVAGPAYQSYAGIVHGGILATMLDEAMGYAVLGEVHDNWAVTADFKIRYHRPTPVGTPLKVAASMIGKRHSFIFSKGTIFMLDGTVLAEAEARYVEIAVNSPPKCQSDESSLKA